MEDRRRVDDGVDCVQVILCCMDAWLSVGLVVRGQNLIERSHQCHNINTNKRAITTLAEPMGSAGGNLGVLKILRHDCYGGIMRQSSVSTPLMSCRRQPAPETTAKTLHDQTEKYSQLAQAS